MQLHGIEPMPSSHRVPGKAVCYLLPEAEGTEAMPLRVLQKSKPQAVC